MPPGKLAFLSLGHAVPMQSYLPKRRAARRSGGTLSQSDKLFWLDVTAPGDGCCYALCDPVACSGAGSEGQKWPLMISAAFTQSLRPRPFANTNAAISGCISSTYARSMRPKDYDYFLITAGPVSLAERFKGRKPSASVSRACYLPGAV